LRDKFFVSTIIPAHIIDQIEREKEQQRDDERPRIEIHIDPEDWRRHPEVGDPAGGRSDEQDDGTRVDFTIQGYVL